MQPRDILFITLSVCAAITTFFFAWLAITLIRIMRGVLNVVEEVQGRIERIGRAIEDLTERVTHSTASITAVAAGVKQLITWFGDRKTSKSARRSKSAADAA